MYIYIYPEFFIFKRFDFFKEPHHARTYILYTHNVHAERVYHNHDYYYCAIVFCNYTAHAPTDPLTNGRQWI
jgi:hypothetical protein